MRTVDKLRLARVLRALATAPWRAIGRNPPPVVVRRGISWNIDWNEGIDLSIALFGSFDRDVFLACRRLSKPGATILDVGANIGAQTLPLAQWVGAAGKVIAFEPSDVAVARLRANLAVNPVLLPRVDVHHAFVGREGATPPASVHSSWPVDGRGGSDVSHGGVRTPSAGASLLCLDRMTAEGLLPRVDLLKLDVDGFESDVLGGAEETLARWKPPIVLELAPGAHDSHGAGRFEEMLATLGRCGYRLRDTAGRAVASDAARLRRSIGADAGMNAVAIHRDR